MLSITPAYRKILSKPDTLTIEINSASVDVTSTSPRTDRKNRVYGRSKEKRKTE
jgi:hypothetical protein